MIRVTNPRRAFTLIELVLVLGLLVIIGGLVAPAASSILNYHRVSRSAELIRSGMMRARLDAMRSGRPQVFQCTIGSGTVTIQAWVDPADAVEAADMAGTVGAGTFAPAMPGTTGTGTTFELEEGVVCKSVQVDTNMRSAPIMTAVANAGVVAPNTGAVQSDIAVSAASPVVFYPDGTATDAIVEVSGDGGSLQMRLRGMTGDITLVDGGA